MSIAIVAVQKRELGYTGGVPKFSWYLQKAIGGDVLYPSELEASGKNYDIIIGDGYNVKRFNDNQKVISVVHGTWKEFAIRNNKLNDFASDISRQHLVWNKKDIIKVAVSYSASYYLEKHHGVKSDKIIYNGIDLSLFKPKTKFNDVLRVLYVANDYNKNNGELLHKTHLLLKDKFDFIYLNAKVGEEYIKFSEGDIFFHPSRYEGNSFGCIEAMASGLPCVVSNVGLFEFMDKNKYNIGEVLDYRSNEKDFANAIVKVSKNIYNYDAVSFVKEFCDYERFKKEWGEFMGG